MRVQILAEPFPGAPEYLTELLDPGIDVRWGDPLEHKLDDYHVLVAGRPSLEHLRKSRLLTSLVIPFSGIPAETSALLLEHYPSLPVYNLHHNATATAEMAMALLFAVAKNLVPADRAIRTFDWRIRYDPNQNLILSGSSATILGYGAVGKVIARMCQAFGMTVHAIQRTASMDEELSGVTVHSITALDDLLPQTDILFIALPLTRLTEGLIDRSRLEKLPEHCILVNVARGAIVEEAALYDCLKEGRIAGAGIDVWYRYPDDESSRLNTPPANYPFHELQNLVMSPHRGGGSLKNERLRLDHLALLLSALARGEETGSRVNLTEGY